MTSYTRPTFSRGKRRRRSGSGLKITHDPDTGEELVHLPVNGILHEDGSTVYCRLFSADYLTVVSRYGGFTALCEWYQGQPYNVRMCLGDKRQAYLARAVMGDPPKMIVSTVNGGPFDLRRDNLTLSSGGRAGVKRPHGVDTVNRARVRKAQALGKAKDSQSSV